MHGVPLANVLFPTLADKLRADHFHILRRNQTCALTFSGDYDHLLYILCRMGGFLSRLARELRIKHFIYIRG
jgi:hypothetical protein